MTDMQLAKTQLNDRPNALAEYAQIVTPPELAGKYTFIKKLGRGSQGAVYKATRISDGLPVAIKQLRIDSVQNWKEYELFQREAHVLNSLDLPGVAKLYETIECLQIESPAAYTVQEFIAGRTLDEMMKAGYRFSINRCFDLATKIVKLLKQLHEHEPAVIHRDIKPSNVMLKPAQGDDFDVYLIDFGAVANPQVQSGGSTVAGTYGYMPPEQLVGTPSPASDIYALGAMLAYMLSGVEPANMRIADFRLVIDPHLENVPRSVIDVLHRMLDPNCDTRLCDHNELLQIFDQFAHDHFIYNNHETELSTQDLTTRLKAVKSFTQAGNLDLWCALSEQTPRQMPRCYERMKVLKQPDLNYERFEYSELHTTKSSNLGLILRNMCASIFGSIILAIATQSSLIGTIIIFLIFFVISFLITCYRFADEAKKDRNIIKKRETERIPYSQIETVVTLPKLLFKGTKTIATVVSFNYHSQDPNGIIAQNSLHRVYRMYKRPCYKLRYRFNPPDDSSEFDLVHEITVHTDYSAELKPGTPLPILYYIEGPCRNLVSSMPYPLPLDDVYEIRDILCTTDNNLAAPVS